MTDASLDWYAAVSKPGRAFDAVGDLRASGLEAFAPKEMRSRRAGRRGTPQREAYAVPACGVYLFLGCSSGLPWPVIAKSKHIVDLLRVQDIPARIDHGSIARMRDLDGVWSTQAQYGGMSPKALRVGDEVTIGDNAWGKVKITALTKGVVTVSFTAFGGERQATVKRAVVENALQAA